jgi:hypothetical protein
MFGIIEIKKMHNTIQYWKPPVFGEMNEEIAVSTADRPMERSTNMDVPDKYNGEQWGDCLTGGSTRRFFCTSQHPGGDYKGTNEDIPEGEPC